MTDEPGFRPETCETVDKLGLLRRVSTADRVPTFGDRIMVEMDRPGQWHSVVVGKYEPPKEIVEDFTSPEMLYVMRREGSVGWINEPIWRWPEPGEWGDDE